MKQAFNELPWHDAVLLRLSVDRSDPGRRDEVVLGVRWPEGKDESITFEDCYALTATMHFGILAPDSILFAMCDENSERLAKLRERWRPLAVELDDLRSFRVTTSSTGGELEVLAKGFRREDLGS